MDCTNCIKFDSCVYKKHTNGQVCHSFIKMYKKHSSFSNIEKCKLTRYRKNVYLYKCGEVSDVYKETIFKDKFVTFNVYSYIKNNSPVAYSLKYKSLKYDNGFLFPKVLKVPTMIAFLFHSEKNIKTLDTLYQDKNLRLVKVKNDYILSLKKKKNKEK